MPEIFDLSHTIQTGMTMYPGSEPPVITPVSTLENSSFSELRISMLTHTGTHIDCPSHILEKGFHVDNVSPARFYGSAMIIDCRMGKSGKIIKRSFLHQYEEVLAVSDFALICTGWSQLWDTPMYYENYPVPDEDAAEYLASFNLKGVGFDTPGGDTVASETFPVHRALLGHNIILIENLANLRFLPPSGFTFACLPLKIKDGDGSPVRAVAIV